MNLREKSAGFCENLRFWFSLSPQLRPLSAPRLLDTEGEAVSPRTSLARLWTRITWARSGPPCRDLALSGPAQGTPGINRTRKCLKRQPGSQKGDFQKGGSEEA